MPKLLANESAMQKAFEERPIAIDYMVARKARRERVSRRTVTTMLTITKVCM